MGSSRLTIGVALVVTGLIAVGIFIAHGAQVPEEAEFVGTAKCRLCHLQQYRTWQQTKHSSNFEVLIGPERSEPDCVRCHVTGYGKPGGFVSEEESPHMTNVGCESCHGPGSAHLEAARVAPATGTWDTKIDKVPAGSACLKCHNPHVRQKERAEQLRQERGAGQ
ncbi:MAG: multiheme c-type cytochrome [Planctomycetota bacterium]|jgi:nitrate/TMAO reductase-like tetraheme cytochrome c subunit